MFDVVNVSADPIRITGIDQVAAIAGTTDAHLYTKVGTWNGSQLTPAAWTLVGSNPAWVHAAFPAPTPLGIPVDVVIPPCGTQGFYVGVAARERPDRAGDVRRSHANCGGSQRVGGRCAGCMIGATRGDSRHGGGRRSHRRNGRLVDRFSSPSPLRTARLP
jgi:hypothetical protein